MADDTEAAEFQENTKEYGWWQERSSSERKCAAVCFVLFLFAFALLVLTIVTNVKLKSVEEELVSVCNTPECVQAASELLDYIDPSVDPCDDFYQFACGNFMKKSVIPDDEMVTSTMGNMQEDIYINLKKLVEAPISREDTEVTIKTKNLYASCVNSSIEDGSVDALQEVLDGVGYWPVVNPKWTQRDLNLERRLAILYAQGIQPFLNAYVREDDKNETDFILHVTAGSLILNNEYYLNSSIPEHEEYVESYKKMIVATARLLDGDEATIQKEVEDMLKFEKEYAKISEEDSMELQRRWEQNETEADDKRYTVNELERSVPKIKWGNLLDYIFEYLNVNARKDDVILTLENRNYIQSLAGLLRRTTIRTVANYLTWRLVFETMPFLDIHFRRLYYDFKKEVPMYSPNAFHFSRWRECIGIVSKIFTMPLTALYVKENFDEERKDEILDIIATLKLGWIGGIYKQKWLDVSTKHLCEEKVQRITTKIGFPRYVLQPDVLDNDFSGLEISKDRFLVNMLKINRHNAETEMALLTGKKKSDSTWIRNPLGVNAFYSAFENTIVFPLAMLRSPVFVPRRPKYLNYAMLGMVVGHEIGHGFDTFGRRVNPDGEHKTWWSQELIDKYKELATCFAEQYSKFPIDNIDDYVNGNWTINDNIADNSGLKNAFRAHQMYETLNGEEPTLPGVPYSKSQIFFITYGRVWCELRTETGSKMYLYDQHSPSRQRINVPMMNNHEFAAAFNCPVGSPMNPEEKCGMWG